MAVANVGRLNLLMDRYAYVTFILPLIKLVRCLAEIYKIA